MILYLGIFHISMFFSHSFLFFQESVPESKNKSSFVCFCIPSVGLDWNSFVGGWGGGGRMNFSFFGFNFCYGCRFERFH